MTSSTTRNDALRCPAITYLALATIVAVVVGCDSGPTAPSPRRNELPRPIMQCNPKGEEVVCTTILYEPELRVVTQSAAWWVVPSDVGTFVQPGVLRPSRVGEAEIHCRIERGSDVFAPRFLIGPGQSARWLHFFAVTVRSSATALGGPVIDGALLEMRDGYQAGQSCVTNLVGTCQIDWVLTGEPFTARISRTGYVTKIITYRVDPPVGNGNPPHLEVILDRAN